MEKLNLFNKISDITNKKIERKKFLLFSGAALLGAIAILKNPFKFINQKSSEKETTALKITPNPNAVRRNSREANNV